MKCSRCGGEIYPNTIVTHTGEFVQHRYFDACVFNLESQKDLMQSKIKKLEAALREIKEYIPANVFPTDAVFHVVWIVDDALKGDVR
jgi:recombinational DNA repair protein (RecF pathway)